MTNFFTNPSPRARLFRIALCLLLLPLLFLGACAKKTNYFDYVSECRSNIFLASNEEFSLKIYAVYKESPYLSDGIPRDCSQRFEAYLVAPAGTEKTELSFEQEGKRVGGEMSYDHVKREYYYSCTADISALSSLPFTVRYGEKEWSGNATSVRSEKTLAPKQVLNEVVTANPDLFQAMTDKYGFAGEIYLRLLYEGATYYYVGVIDRNGRIHAFLLNAESGKILATKAG